MPNSPEQPTRKGKFTQDDPTERKDYQPSRGDPADGGKLPPYEAERIQSADLPSGDVGSQPNEKGMESQREPSVEKGNPADNRRPAA